MRRNTSRSNDPYYSDRYSSNEDLDQTRPLPRAGRNGYGSSDYERSYEPNRRAADPRRRAPQRTQRPTQTRRRSAPPPPQQPKKKRHIAAIIVIVLLALLAGTLLFVNHLFNSYNYDSTNESALTLDNNSVNIALFGVDTREGNAESGTRSDAIMVMNVNGNTGKIKMVSLMRDSYVNIPGYGMTKLAHAYSYGGPQLAMDVLNQDFDLNISEYISVDFGEMANIIDSVGGVTINVTKAERKETNKFIKEYCKANGLKYKKNKIKKSGEQKLNGVQAMTYGRIRKGNTGGDWSRTERQSTILNQVFAKATSGNPITLVRFLNGLMPNITTSLSKDDFMLLAKTAASKGKPAMEHTRLPLDGEWNYGTTADGMSVITFSDEILAQHLKEYFYNDITPSAVSSESSDSAVD